jgi:hypothetical protein
MRRKLPPWSRHHQDWCAIFRSRPCDCDDDNDRRERGPRNPPLGGGEVPPRGEVNNRRAK